MDLLFDNGDRSAFDFNGQVSIVYTAWALTSTPMQFKFDDRDTNLGLAFRRNGNVDWMARRICDWSLRKDRYPEANREIIWLQASHVQIRSAKILFAQTDSPKLFAAAP